MQGNNYYSRKMDKLEKGESVWDNFNEITQFRKNISELITTENRTLTEFEQIADALANEYLVGTNENLENEISKEFHDYVRTYNDKNIEVPGITQSEILQSIVYVKKARTLENTVPKYIYKTFAETLVIPLTILFNVILSVGKVPNRMKEALCTPLNQGKGKRTIAGSFRAIFHLSFITKVFEKICITG